MGPRLYYWKHMLRDYVLLASDPHWYWCGHCRRPVEHGRFVDRHLEQGAVKLTCFDCGCAVAETADVEQPRMRRA